MTTQTNTDTNTVGPAPHPGASKKQIGNTMTEIFGDPKVKQRYEKPAKPAQVQAQRDQVKEKVK